MKLLDIVKPCDYTKARNWAVAHGYTMKQVKGGYQIVEQSVTEQDLCSFKRSERDRALNAVMWRVERYRQQKELGISTTDTESEYKQLLTYIQTLRDITKHPDFPNVDIPEYDDF